MIEVTDEYMLEMLKGTKNYSIVLLKNGTNYKNKDAEKMIWEHGRRNFLLRREGVLQIVCPAPGGHGLAGIAIFGATLEEVKRIMDDDPAVKAGVLIYEAYACRSFPGDCLR